MIRTIAMVLFFAVVLTMNVAAIEEWVSFTGSSIPAPAETTVIEQGRSNLIINMALDGMNVQEKREHGRDFQHLSIPQANWTAEPGKPKLPIIRTLLMVPSDGNIEIQIEDAEYTSLEGYSVYPVGEEVVKYKGMAEYIGEEFAIDEDFYSTNSLYPQQLASISFSGYLREQRLVQLELHPIRHNPRSGELMCYSFIQIQLSYEGQTNGSLGGSGALSSVYQNNVANYDIYGAPPAAMLGADRNGSVSYPEDLMENHDADYVIIVPDQFYNSQRIRKLADWRAQYSNLDVLITSTSKLYHHFGAGRGLDENIRSFVEYIYNYWTAKNMPDGHVGYVLLIGDVELLPIHVSEKKSFGESIATDNWYACVSGDDLMPDVMLGRLPAKTLTELNRMVDKIIQYEQEPFFGDWANNALLMLGTVEALRDDMEHARDEFLLPAGYNVSEVSGMDGGNASRVISKFNAGQLIVDYAGHGWVSGWEIFDRSNIASLRNDRKLPVVFSLACSTGKFDDPGTDSLAEALVKEKDGAIAFFGSSRLAAISDVGFGLSEAVAGSHIGTLGEITMHTKLKLLPNSTNMELYNLLGDPALDIYAARREPSKVDLVVSSVDISFGPQNPKQGEEVQINVAIHNFGVADARDIVVRLWDIPELDFSGNSVTRRLIETHDIANLPAGDKTNIEIPWLAPMGEAQHCISVSVSPSDKATEHYVENNDAQRDIQVSLEAEGWPLETEDRTLSATIAADIDADGSMELLSQCSSYNKGRLYIWQHDGQAAAGWPQTITGGRQNANIQYSNSSAGPAPAVGDIDGDGEVEIIAASFRDQVYAWRSDGSRMPGWPAKVSGYATTSPALADLDGDGKLEVICGLANGRMDIRRSDGTSLPGWPVSAGRSGHLFPAISDMDGDGDLEIAALLASIPKGSSSTNKLYAWHHDGTKVEGWPVTLQGSNAILPPVAGDLDGDGKTEIVASSYNGDISLVYAWRHDGSSLSGWPIEVDDEIRAAFALGDLDKDGDVEIIASTYRDFVYAWHHDGKRVFGWPVTIGTYGRSNSAPILGDVDGDDQMEVIFTSYGGVVHALKKNGIPAKGWPAITEERYTTSPPVIADMDGDGKAELAYASSVGRVHMLSLIGNYGVQTGSEWNMFMHDQMHTGSYNSKAILPQPPTGLTAVDLPDDNGSSISLSWVLSPDDENISGYVIYRADSYDGQYSMIGKTLNAVSKYTDGTAKAGVTYWYIVRASDGMYLSVGSNLVNAYSINNFAPGAPEVVEAHYGNMDRTLSVWWNERTESDVAGYRIYYGTSSKAYDKSVAVDLTYYCTLTELTNGTKYFISVTAFDEDGNESLYSKEVTAIPQDEDNEPPSFSKFYPRGVAEGVKFLIKCSIFDPSGVYDDSSDADGQGIYLVWDNDGELDETSYKIQMSSLNSDTYITDEKIPGQSVESHFVYQIYAHDNDNDWDESADRTPGKSPEQIVEFIKVPNEVYNYPNPAPAYGYGDKTIFRYYVKDEADVKIGIYDIGGQKVGDFETQAIGGQYNEQEWDISNIASGIYVYVIEIQPSSGEKQIVKKKLAIVR